MRRLPPAVLALANGRTEDGTIASPDGRTWGIKVFPLQDRDGRIVGLIEWASDISEKAAAAQGSPAGQPAGRPGGDSCRGGA